MVHTKQLNIALAGNPNCGKTTIFNALTGSAQRVGNWPGVTVEKKEGDLRSADFSANIVDLPGIYSLSVDSEDEKAARDYLLNGEVDLVVNILDSTNLERNLFLTTQLLEMGVPTLVVLNMADLLSGKGLTISAKTLSSELGVPVIAVSATEKDGIRRIIECMDKSVNSNNDPNGAAKVKYASELEREITGLQKDIASLAELQKVSPRWMAVKALEQDEWVHHLIVSNQIKTGEGLQQMIQSIQDQTGEEPDILLADGRYSFIHKVCDKAVTRGAKKVSVSEKIDSVVMHRLWGIPIFFAAMFMVFWVTMGVGGSLIDFFDILFGTVFVDGFSHLLGMVNAPEWLIGFLAGGIGGGIQTVATFLPVVFFMFLMLSILEDSGYMARAAFVMDRFMRAIGLPGKSFVPMLVGFGCTVPAIMATRTLDSKRDRFMTIFMTPFMSCGARLPVYALFGAALFGMRSGLIVFSIYIAGIVLAILTGLLLKHTLFKGEFSPFVMELPSYHAPKIGMVLGQSWRRLKIFALRAGKVIILAVLVLSLLNTLGWDGSIGNEDSEDSVLAGIGKAITPVFSPMGISEENWPATVGLFTGIFAKEAVVGTLNSLYLAESGALEDEGNDDFDFLGGIAEAFQSIGENFSSLIGTIIDPFGLGVISSDEEFVAEEIDADIAVFERMRYYFSPASAYAYLLFILIYFPCVAALGAAIRETGPFYGTVLVTYLTLLAWIVSTLFYQIMEGRELLWILTPLILLTGIILSFKVMSRKSKKLDASIL